MWILYTITIIVGVIILRVTKNSVQNEAQSKIDRLNRELNKQNEMHEHEKQNLLERFNKLDELHRSEIARLEARLSNSDSIQIQRSEFADIVAVYAWKEMVELYNDEFAFIDISKTKFISPWSKENVKESVKDHLRAAIIDQYKYRYLTYLYPELADVFDGVKVKESTPRILDERTPRSDNLFEIVDILRSSSQTNELIYWKNRVAFLEASKSNLTAIPYMAGIMADYETYGLEHLAKELDWGHAMKRMDKVKAIREIRRDAQAMVEKHKVSQYQLAYILNMFPNLEDFINAEFSQLPVIEVTELSEYDSVRDYLSKEEYANLSETERNQLALDRYKKSHNRTKWQIGRDYELYVGYRYTQKGYNVDYFGSYMGLEDLGRDLIAKKGDEILIIQCKYWSAKKEIHENHVNQLYGTMVSYCIEHRVDRAKVKGVLITNIKLSQMAKKMAYYLGVEYVENYESGEYPCIKCNIGHGKYGEMTKIYHLISSMTLQKSRIKESFMR